MGACVLSRSGWRSERGRATIILLSARAQNADWTQPGPAAARISPPGPGASRALAAPDQGSSGPSGRGGRGARPTCASRSAITCPAGVRTVPKGTAPKLENRNLTSRQREGAGNKVVLSALFLRADGEKKIFGQSVQKHSPKNLPGHQCDSHNFFKLQN